MLSASQPKGRHNMHSLDRVRLLGSAFFSRTVHLHGLATAAAMLTCVAVVLNVGPFARTPKTDGLTANREAARTVMEQPIWSNSFPQSGVRPENISEPITALIRPSSISVVEVAPLATQAGRPRTEMLRWKASRRHKVQDRP